MDFRQFVDAVVAQDERNVFVKASAAPSDMPCALRHFYEIYDPVDVEIVLGDLTSIKLTSMNEISALQADYTTMDGVYIFATCEGDPIAFQAGAIVTWTHGRRQPKVEKLADSFDQWLLQVIEAMKKATRSHTSHDEIV